MGVVKYLERRNGGWGGGTGGRPTNNPTITVRGPTDEAHEFERVDN